MQLPTAPMLAAPTASPKLAGGWAAEPKWDGYRALVGRWRESGEVAIRSRQGTDMTAGFPEITAAVAALPAAAGDVLLDGELVVWHEGRLDFDRLQSRLGGKPVRIRRLAAEEPASFVVFDLLHVGGGSLVEQPYRERRARLESLFAELRLAPPLNLCPSSSDPEEVAAWLDVWAAYGIEGVCFKRLDQSYQPGRKGWLKYRRRSTTEAVVGAVTGSVEEPQALLLGRFDEDGLLRFVARSTPLDPQTAADLAGRLTPAHRPGRPGRPGHPWLQEHFTSRWRPATPIRIALVEPELVAEFSADIPQDRDGGWRQLVRFLRLRPDLRPEQAPRFGERHKVAGDEALHDKP